MKLRDDALPYKFIIGAVILDNILADNTGTVLNFSYAVVAMLTDGDSCTAPKEKRTRASTLVYGKGTYVSHFD